MSDRATDGRPPYFLVEDAVIDKGLTPYEGWLYIVILKHANRKTGEAFPGIARLCKLAKMSKSQVLRAISTLEDKSLIRVERDTKPLEGEKRQRAVNHYFILAVNSSSSQELGVVPDRYYPSVQQELGVVPTSDKNQYSSKQKEENNKSGAKSKSQIEEEKFRAEWSKYAALGTALLAAFGNDFVPAENQTVNALSSYLDVARELTIASAKVEEIPFLSKYIASRARREEWSKYSVKTFSRYYTDFLKSRRDKIINDDPAMDLNKPVDITPILMRGTEEEAS